MTSGDTITSDNADQLNFTWIPDDDFVTADGEPVGNEANLPFRAGDTMNMSETEVAGSVLPAGVKPGTTASIVWTSPEGDKTDVLQEFDVPA